MSVLDICIFRAVQLLTKCYLLLPMAACLRSPQKLKLCKLVKFRMRRLKIFIGVLIPVVFFWVLGILTHGFYDDVARRSVIENENEFDTDFEVWGEQDANDANPKLKLMQEAVADALRDSDDDDQVVVEPQSEEEDTRTLRVVYTAIDGTETTRGVPTTTKMPLTQRADGKLDTQITEKDYDGRFEEPTDDILQSFTDIPALDTRMDSFNMKTPIKFLPNYRNPCWFETVNVSVPLYKYNFYTWLYPGWNHARQFEKDFQTMRGIIGDRVTSGPSEQSWRIRCLPYFYIIGMPRCGSTDLTYSIGFHPYVIHSRLKEFKYWNRVRLSHPARKVFVVKQPWYQDMMSGKRPVEKGAIDLNNYPHAFRHYIETFDYMGEISRNRTKGKTRNGLPFHPMIIGDESPSYMFDFDAWEELPIHKGLTEPKFTTAHYIKQLTPYARFIITLRNPTDRLFSDYKAFYTRQTKSEKDFDELVRVNIAKFNKCIKTRTVRSCAYSHNSTLPMQPVRPRVGLYYIYLIDWFATFPRDQFYITRLEDFAGRKSAIASEIFDFLALPPLKEEALADIDEDVVHNTAVHRVGKLADVSELQMWNSTRKIIDDFYRPWNAKLAELLGDDKYLFL